MYLYIERYKYINDIHNIYACVCLIGIHFKLFSCSRIRRIFEILEPYQNRYLSCLFTYLISLSILPVYEKFLMYKSSTPLQTCLLCPPQLFGPGSYIAHTDCVSNTKLGTADSPLMRAAAKADGFVCVTVVKGSAVTSRTWRSG